MGALQTILLATDGSPSAADAAKVAASLAQQAGGQIHLVSVWQFNPPYAELQVAAESGTLLYDTYEQAGREVLARVAEGLQAEGTPIAGQYLRQGRSVNEVCDVAAEIGADLIVMGSRGLSPVRRLVLGSVAQGVTHDAPCPVLVVRGGPSAWPPARIVLGDDGSATAREAEALAALLAKIYGAKGVIVRTYRPLPDRFQMRDIILSNVMPDNRETQAQEARQLRDEAIGRAEQELTARAVALAAEFGERPEVVVATGDPADALLTAAEADGGSALIAVGSRGLGTLQRLRLGSVSTTVLHGAAGSVLIVPAHAAEEAS